MSPGGEDYFRYLPVSRRATQWGLYVTGAGCAHWAPQSKSPQSVHPELYQFTWERGRVLPEYQVIYLTSGSGVFESGPTGVCELTAGDVVVLFPGVWHRYRPCAETGWETYWIGLNGSYLHYLLEESFITPDEPVFPAGLVPALQKPYEDILAQIHVEALGNPLLLAAKAMEILAQVVAPVAGEPAEASTQAFSDIVEDRMVAEAVRYIWNHSHRPMTVTDVVSSLPVTRRSLERRFHKAVGHTILDEITRCRIERVKRMLEETDLPIKRIAATVGFSNPQRMTKVFHRLEGVSPTTYRQQCRPS